MADQGRSRRDIWASEASLSLLGPMRLTSRSGKDWTPKARKTRGVLAVVALAKGPVSRARLTDLLWGDRGEDQAKASLRQALYELRELGTSGLLTTSRESVELGPKRLWTDTAVFEAATDPREVADYLQDIQWPLLSD